MMEIKTEVKKYFDINFFNELFDENENNNKKEIEQKKQHIKEDYDNKIKQKQNELKQMELDGYTIVKKQQKPKKIDVVIDNKYEAVDNYLKSVIFPSKDGAYFFYDLCNDTKIVKLLCYSEKAFMQVYGIHLQAKYKQWKLIFTEKYQTTVSNKDFVIDYDEKLINLAKSFNYKYEQGFMINEKSNTNVEFFLNEFIKGIICDGDNDLYDALLHILSCYCHRVQTEIILWLVGFGGVGKSFFAEQFMSELFGQSCVLISENFLRGDTQFNSSLLGSNIAIVPETSGKGEDNFKEQQRNLKSLATSKILTIRKMYSEGFTVNSILNLVLCTNKIVDIFQDRRNFVLEPSSKEINNKDFYKKLACVIEDKNAMQMIFNKLYEYNDDKFKISSMKIPEGEAHKSIKDNNFLINAFIEFLYKTFVYDVVKGIKRKQKMNIPEIYELYMNNNNCKIKFGENTIKQNFRQILLFSGGMTNGNKTYHTDEKNVLERITLIMNWGDNEINELKKKYDDMNEPCVENHQVGLNNSLINMLRESQDENELLKKQIEMLNDRIKQLESSVIENKPIKKDKMNSKFVEVDDVPYKR